MYKIQSIQQTPIFEKGGTISSVYQVIFMVGDHGPFTLRFTPEQFTTEGVKKQLTDFAQKITDISAVPA